MGCLYRLTFPNGKAYIGVTLLTAGTRFKSHCAKAHAQTGPVIMAVSRAIKKYGSESITVETLVTCSDMGLLSRLEKVGIAFWKTVSPGGYNISVGGDNFPVPPESRKRAAEKMRGRHRSEKTRQRLSEAHMGKKLTAEHRAKLSAAKKGKTPWNKGRKGQVAWNRGQPFSTETRQRMSEAVVRRWARTREDAHC